MRETAAGTLFTWSKNRQFYCRFLSWPAPLCFFFVTTLLIEATRFGVSERIGDESFNCCGMPLNTSQSRRTNFSCVCDGVNRTHCRGGVSNALYRLDFCRSIPLYELLNAAVLQNRTLCHEQLKKLQEADKSANGSYKMFEEIIARMDCGEDEKDHTYSVTSTCRECLAAYKNWICYTEVSGAILDLNKSAHRWKRPCPKFCETVLQKCPYLPPVPNFRESLVQVGYSAFNCLDHEEWTHSYGNLEDQCVDIEPLQENDEYYDEPTFKPAETTKGFQAMNSTTTNSTNGSKR